MATVLHWQNTILIWDTHKGESDLNTRQFRISKCETDIPARYNIEQIKSCFLILKYHFGTQNIGLILFCTIWLPKPQQASLPVQVLSGKCVLWVTGGNITEAFQWAPSDFFFLASDSAPVNYKKSTGSILFTYNEKVKSILQATASDVYKTSIWKHTKIKLHQYIIYMQWRARKVNKGKILMQKHAPRETTNATNVHHQQYSSYMTLQIRTQNTKIKTTSISDN